MTSFQKIVKYIAIAFAIYLCIVIIGIIIFGITVVFGVTTGMGIFEDTNQSASITKWEEEYSKVEYLDVDLSIGKLTIKKGNTLKIEASNVSDKFECKTEGNQLKIKDDKVYQNVLLKQDFITPEVILYLPENIKFTQAIIETGMNETNIEELKADKIKLEMGIGKYQIKAMKAQYLEIESGTGEANIDNVQAEELKLNSGIGKLVLTAEITKKADVNSGMGEVELNFIGSQNDYTIKTETGLGNFVVNGQKIKDNQTIGNGNAILKIDAGVGQTTVNFQEGLNKM